MPGKAPRKAHAARKTRTRRDSAQRVRVNEDPPRRLALDEGLERGGRVGDPRSRDRHDREFPPARGREAGQSGGEIADGDVTADDAAPETLLDDERSATPSDRGRREPLDTVLRGRDPETIGTGRGKDEAELADDAPVGAEESRRLRRKAHEHARDPNHFEPAEAVEQAARTRARGRPH